MEVLSQCGQQLKRWGANKFGYLPTRISDLQAKTSQLNYVLTNDDNLISIRQMETKLDHLLALDESYWKQRSIMDWLANGDTNTKFFHHKASTRRRINRINGILSSTNEWQTDSKEVQSIFLQYFTSFFTSPIPSTISLDIALNDIDDQITDIMRVQLDAP